MNVETNEDLVSIWQHLEELRLTFIKIAWVIIVGTSIAFIFHQPIEQFLVKPLDNLILPSHPNHEIFEIKTHRLINASDHLSIYEIPHNGRLKNLGLGAIQTKENSFELLPKSYLDWEEFKPIQQLIILSPIEAFATSIKISLWLGITVTSPLWLYYFLQFITPALHKREKRLIFPFLILSFFFISLGICFAYLVTIPIANLYLYSFNQDLGLNLWTFSNYMDYTLLLMLSNAFAFELFVVVLLLVHYGFLKATTMQEKRRHVIVAAFILGAILTPPDVLSQVLMAIPLILLYEMTILYALFKSSLNMNSN